MYCIKNYFTAKNSCGNTDSMKITKKFENFKKMRDMFFFSQIRSHTKGCFTLYIVFPLRFSAFT